MVNNSIIYSSSRDLENKSIFDKEMLRKDFERRLAQEKAEVLSSIDDRLPAKAKKAHLSFMRIKAEMKLQTKQADQLLEVTKLSFDKEHEMKRELELSRSSNDEMVKRLAMYQTTIKDLTKQLEDKSQLLDVERIQSNELTKRQVRCNQTCTVYNNQTFDIFIIVFYIFASFVCRSRLFWSGLKSYKSVLIERQSKTP